MIMTIEQKTNFINNINKARLNAHGGWYQGTETINGIQVKYKGFKTWVQRMEYLGIVDGSNMVLSVREFKEYLLSVASYISNETSTSI